MKKNVIYIIMVLCLFTGTLTGCGQTEESVGTKESRLHIVCTTFPQYDWVNEILGENPEQVEVTLLVNDGTDIHNFQPSAADIAKMTTCDLFIYVGGESDEWVEDILLKVTNENMETIDMMDALGELVRIEEIVEGMEEEQREGEQEEEYDEHVWLSLRNAAEICKVITASLEKLDSENREVYNANLTSYQKKLTALDKKYQSVVDSAKGKTLLFGDRFPFRYLADAYGLEYYAAFPGCSAETEASFATIVFLAEKTDELGLNFICVPESSDQSIAQTIIRSTKGKGQDMLVLDSLQSVTAEDIENNITYLSIMEQNLEVLKQALN